MTLAAGSRLGPYEILSAIGAGRIGERRLRLLGALRLEAHRLAARPKGLDHEPDPSLRFGSRGARLLPRFRAWVCCNDSG
jgi:hypothetical protein